VGEVTDEQIRAVVALMRQGFHIRYTASKAMPPGLIKAIKHYVHGPMPLLRDPWYGRVQEAMALSPQQGRYLFPRGRVVWAGQLARDLEGVALREPGQALVWTLLLERHQTGDWGEVDDHDRAVNNRAAKHGQRVLSAYEWRGKKVWCITEWDRSVTTFLYPEDY
jgi:hypothetical protein